MHRAAPLSLRIRDRTTGGSHYPSATMNCPASALNVLRAAGRPMHMREIAVLVLTAKGLDPLDRTLPDATVKWARDVLLLPKRKGTVRLMGLQRARSARWALVEAWPADQPVGGHAPPGPQAGTRMPQAEARWSSPVAHPCGSVRAAR
jgi:hypothetical protein